MAIQMESQGVKIGSDTFLVKGWIRVAGVVYKVDEEKVTRLGHMTRHEIKAAIHASDKRLSGLL